MVQTPADPEGPQLGEAGHRDSGIGTPAGGGWTESQLHPLQTVGRDPRPLPLVGDAVHATDGGR